MSPQDHIDYISKVIDFDMEKVAKAKSRKMFSSWQLENTLVVVHNLLAQAEIGLAIHKLNDCYDMLIDLVTSDRNWLVQNVDEFKVIITNHALVTGAYQVWLDTDFKAHLDQYRKYDIFKADELDQNKIDPQMFLDLHTAMDKKLVQAFRFRGKGKVELPGDHKIKDNLVLIDSLEVFFNSIRQTDEVVVYVVMKIEQIIDYSYFLVVVAYKENIWVINDQIEFDNPRNKSSRRRPERDREKYQEFLCFPYYMIDELVNKMRKGGSRDIVRKTKENVEFFNKPILELHEVCRIFLLYSINHYIKNIHTVTKHIGLLGQTVDRLLLNGNQVIDPTNPDKGFEGYEDHVREVHNEVIQEANFLRGQSTALVPMTAAITKHSQFDRNWLGTPKQLENVAKWMVLDTERGVLQKEIDKKFKPDREGRRKYLAELNSLISKPENFDRLAKYLFSGDEVNMEVNGFERAGDWGFSVKKNLNVEFLKNMTEKPEIGYKDGRLWFDNGDEKRREEWRKMYRPRPSYNKYVWRCDCIRCKKVKAAPIIHLHIRHYSQFMFLANCKQEELPAYLKLYRAHNYVPYHGNSILDNTHPMALLEHPSWDDFPNGFDIGGFLCKRCVTDLYKLHKIADKTLIRLDGTIEAYDDGKTTMHSTRINI